MNYNVIRRNTGHVICIATVHGKGHPNITLEHPTSLELSGEDFLTPRGDCIACISVNLEEFSKCKTSTEKDEKVLGRLIFFSTSFLEKTSHATICGLYVGLQEEKRAVIRKTGSLVSGTLLSNSTHSAKDLKKDKIATMKSGLSKCIAVLTLIEL